MTTTEQARDDWSELLKEMFAETGIHVDPNLAGQRAMHRLAQARRENAIQASKIVELECIVKACCAV